MADLPVFSRDLRIDDVSGLPRLTIDQSDFGGIGPISFCLAPDAVRALVDALVGVAEATPDECRIVVKCATGDLGRALLAMPSVRPLPPTTGDVVAARADLDTSPTNRRLQVISRLADMASHAGRTALDVAEAMVMTRDEYPDVFADLADHLGQVAAISRGYDEPADPRELTE